MESVTQSLAGRVALLELLPMSTQELINAGVKKQRKSFSILADYLEFFTKILIQL
jgi:hypothetical protein